WEQVRHVDAERRADRLRRAAGVAVHEGPAVVAVRNGQACLPVIVGRAACGPALAGLLHARELRQKIFNRGHCWPPFDASTCRLSQAWSSAAGYKRVCRLPVPTRTTGITPSCVNCQRRRGEMPSARAACHERKARLFVSSVPIVNLLQRSLAATCGSHNPWRSVRDIMPNSYRTLGNSRQNARKSAGRQAGENPFDVRYLISDNRTGTAYCPSARTPLPGGSRPKSARPFFRASPLRMPTFVASVPGLV